LWIIGVIAFIQVVWLPGAVLFRLLRISLNPLETMAGVFATSLISNCITVTLLVSLGLHTSAAWWFIIVAEVAYLVKTNQRRGLPWRLDCHWLERLRRMDAESTLSAITFLAVLIVFMGFFIHN
jgi:hypothetical protein